MKQCFALIISVLVASFAQAQTSEKTPSGYTYKIETGAAGKEVYISGQRPFDADGNLVGGNDLDKQTKQVFDNLSKALTSVGMTMQDVKQITYLLKGEPGFVNLQVSQRATQASAAYFVRGAPGISDVKSVAKIGQDEVLIEVEVVAVK